MCKPGVRAKQATLKANLGCVWGGAESPLRVGRPGPRPKGGGEPKIKDKRGQEDNT